ncbi:MAG: hypothetical protein ACE5OZ_04850 [Candidatus Heimdallarchaeota archaeon]
MINSLQHNEQKICPNLDDFLNNNELENEVMDSIHTISAIEIKTILTTIENSIDEFSILVKKKGGRNPQILEQLTKITCGFRSKVYEDLENLESFARRFRAKIPLKRITINDHHVPITIPAPILFEILHRTVMDAHPKNRVRHGLFIEYIIAAMSFLSKIKEAPPNFHAIVQIAAMGATARDKERDLAKLVSLFETNKKENIISLNIGKVRKCRFDILITQYKRIAASSFTKSIIDELLRQKLGIPRILDIIGESGRKKIKYLARGYIDKYDVAGIVNQPDIVNDTHRDARFLIQQEILWFKIFEWIKVEMENSGTERVVVLGDGGPPNHLQAKIIRLLSTNSLNTAKKGSKTALLQLDKDIRIFGNAIAALTSEKRIGGTYWHFTSATLGKPSSRMMTTKRYNAYRLAFSELLEPAYEQLVKRHIDNPRGPHGAPDLSRFAGKWIKYAEPPECSGLVSREKSLTQEQVDSLLNAIDYRLQKSTVAKIQYYSKKDFNILEKQLNEGNLISKIGLSALSSSIVEKSANDPDFKAIGLDNRLSFHVRKELDIIRKKAPIGSNRNKEWIEIVKYWWNNFTRKKLEREEFYQFLQQSLWQKELARIKPKSALEKEFISIFKTNEWTLDERLSITNLRDKGEGYNKWVLDHLFVYKNIRINKYVVIGVQDKVVKIGRGQGGFRHNRIVDDIEKLENFMSGLFYKIRGELWSKSGVLTPNHIHPDDSVKLRKIMHLQRMGFVASNFCVLRYAEVINEIFRPIGRELIEESSQRLFFHVCYLIWKPIGAAFDIIGFLNHFKKGGEKTRKWGSIVESILRLIDDFTNNLTEKPFDRFQNMIFWGMDKHSLLKSDLDFIYFALMNKFNEIAHKLTDGKLCDLTYSAESLKQLGYEKMSKISAMIKLLRKETLEIELKPQS